MTRRRWWPLVWQYDPRKFTAAATEFPNVRFVGDWIGPECRTKAEALKAAREELKRRAKK